MTLALLHYFDNDPKVPEHRRRLKDAFDHLFPELTKYFRDGDTARKIRSKYDTLINHDPKPLRAASIIIGAAVLVPLLCAGATDAATDVWVTMKVIHQDVPYTMARKSVQSLRDASRWVASVANLILPPAAIFGGVRVLARHMKSMQYVRDIDQLITDGKNAIKIAKERDEESDRRGRPGDEGRIARAVIPDPVA